MSRLWALFLAAVCALMAVPALADAPAHQPDLLSLGLNYDDFDKSESHRQSADFRGEYRWGVSFLSLGHAVQFHPFVGVELGTWNQFYGLGGYAMDAYLGRHIIFTWSEGVGLFNRGEAMRMGSVVEFRSMAEIGYRFTNEMRVTLTASHISNAGITKINPGAELAGIYVHIPINLMEKQPEPARWARP